MLRRLLLFVALLCATGSTLAYKHKGMGSKKPKAKERLYEKPPKVQRPLNEDGKPIINDGSAPAAMEYEWWQNEVRMAMRSVR